MELESGGLHIVAVGDDARTTDRPQGMKPASEKKKATGEVPAYLKNQLANYQAGLNRLTGGG